MTKAWKQGPRLSHAPYPDVLVYRAVSDGRALQAGIQMMTADTVELQFDQLRPHGLLFFHDHGAGIGVYRSAIRQTIIERICGKFTTGSARVAAPPVVITGFRMPVV